MKKNKKIITFSLALVLTLLIVAPALAVDSLVDTNAPGYAKGDYTLDYIRYYAIYLARIILGLVGSLSLLAFVYGGVTFLLSGGSSEEVKKGMGILKAAVIGILITFSSALIINVFLGGLGINQTGKDGAAKFNTETGAITPQAPITPTK
ncbi:MAG: hypothetical protein WAW11_00820 [Patescibacteria group bacterium]